MAIEKKCETCRYWKQADANPNYGWCQFDPPCLPTRQKYRDWYDHPMCHVVCHPLTYKEQYCSKWRLQH